MSLDVFNPEMLVLAREAEGLTQAAFAKLAGVSQSKVSKVEEGLSIPPTEELGRWAELLNQGAELFGRTGPARPPSLSFYRKTAALPIKLFTQCNARMNLRRIAILQELGGRCLPRDLDLPYIPVSNEKEAEEAARQLRKMWRLPSGPVANLLSLVERTGCVVQHFDFRTEKIDGLAICGGTPTPFIFLNQQYPADRLRLSLAHELGHLVMHREIKETVEEEAWAFAAEFLMPGNEIRHDLYPLSIESLAQLKLKWLVSMQALLKRARTLGQVQERYSQFLWMRMGQYGYRKSEPLTERIPREIPTPLKDLMRDG